jgi:transcriptional regulator with XRE-family HTH domain
MEDNPMKQRRGRAWGHGQPNDDAIVRKVRTIAGAPPEAARKTVPLFDPAQPFPWGPTSLNAAELLAENELTLNEIAARSGISRNTLWQWRQHPEFAEAVAERTAELVAAMHKHFLAKKHKRIATLDRLHKKALNVIEQRAQDPDLQKFPGGDTGLLVIQKKQMGLGRNATVVTEAVFDRALVAEIREIQQQAARELGQWVEKAETTTTVSFTDLFGLTQGGAPAGGEVIDLDDVREALALQEGADQEESQW